MSRPTHFRLRWKGALTGPFPLVRIQEMLRAGEISLLHNIEVDESWMTVRDYFRAIGLSRGVAVATFDNAHPTSGAPTSAPGEELPVGEALSPAASRNAAGESLERSVREGYLWCGSTFLLPPTFGLAVYAWHLVSPETPPISLFILLAFTTALGCFLPVAFVRKVGRTLDQEGLAEIRQTQANLAILLAGLGFVLWSWCFWILVYPRP
jgi:hypothetical protein